jgi:hypothetical protein
MIKQFIIIIFLSCSVFSQEKNLKTNNYSIKFKALSFDESFESVGYMEGKDVRILDIYIGSLSSEASYSGKQELEFVKQVKLTQQPDENKVLLNERNTSREKLEILSDEFNNYVKRLSEILDPIKSDEREPNSSEKQSISEINVKLVEIEKKIRDAQAEVIKSDSLYIKKITQTDRDNPVKIQEVKTQSKKDLPTLPPTKYEPLAKFTIPASGGNYILIFNKTPNGVTISPLNDAPGVFPFGSYQFINLTGTTVELRFGSKVIPLNPNGRTVFKPETANGEYLEGEFWTKVDDEFKLGYKFRNLHISRIRTLAFIMPTAPGQSALNLKIAEERGQAEPPPADNSKSKDKKAKESEKKESENRPFG